MKVLIAAVLPLMLIACASSNTASTEPTEQKVYRTGSNLPVRDPEPGTPNKTIDSSTLRPAPVPSLNPNRTGG